jgi:spore germination protein KC
MKTNRGSLFILFINVCLLLTGCWNSRELTDMSIVVGMGIDHVPESGEYRLSLQIVNSGSLPSGSKGGSTGALPVTVFSEQDKSLFGALRKMSRKVPRRLFFGHIQLVVIGEPVARKGINDLFDFFERSHEVRMNSTVLISRGTSAEDLIRIVTPLEKTPSVGIAKRTRISSEVWAENLDMNITDIINDLVSPGEPAISGVQVGGGKPTDSMKNLQTSEPPNFISVTGVGLFKKGKLIGWLDSKLARGVLWIRNQMKGTIVNLPCADLKKKQVIVVVRSQTTVKTQIEQGIPTFDIHIKEEGNVGETQCVMNLDTRESILQLQNKWADETRKEVLATIKELQRRQIDALEFGATLQQLHPKKWKPLEKDWPRIFSKSDVHVHVEAYLRRTGMRGNSYLYEMEKAEEKAAKK